MNHLLASAVVLRVLADELIELHYALIGFANRTVRILADDVLRSVYLHLQGLSQ